MVSNILYCLPPWEMIQFHYLKQMGWFNHQPDTILSYWQRTPVGQCRNLMLITHHGSLGGQEILEADLIAQGFSACIWHTSWCAKVFNLYLTHLEQDFDSFLLGSHFPAVAIFILKVMGQAFLLLRGARSKTGKLRQWERPVREILND